MGIILAFRYLVFHPYHGHLSTGNAWRFPLVIPALCESIDRPKRSQRNMIGIENLPNQKFG
jgi:hypothetical protein